MRIAISKAIEIIELNLKEAARSMPPDLKTTLELCLDNFVGLQAERAIHGYTRIGQLPHESDKI